MVVGVISDTHDNFYNLDRAMGILLKRGITTCLHLGDFCAPGTVSAMTEYETMQWICVWGNVDGDKAKIVLEQSGNSRFDIGAEPFREYQLKDKLIFLTHFPALARNAAETGKYAACFYGHDHLRHMEVLSNGTILANPGEIVGFKTKQPSLGIYDVDTNEFEIIDLDDFIVARA